MSVQKHHALQELRSKTARLQMLPVRRTKTIIPGNAGVDPVARLPVELSSKIFCQCGPHFTTSPRACFSPMLLLNVCCAWTAIALSTSDLWTTIHIVFPCAAGLTQLLPIWFQRAGNRPLSMYLSGDFGEVDHRVFSVIWRLGAQLKRLEICDNMPKELLHDWDFLQLLRLAPNLVECVFARLETVDGLYVPSKTLVLPTLRRLFFGESDHSRPGPESDDETLNVLTLPALENLSLAMRISGNDLFSFFQRSAPPLRELVVGLMIEPRNAGLHKSLRLIPTLTRLEMWSPNPQFLADLFPALASSPSLLPNLLSLILYVNMWQAGVISDSSWSALSTRRFRLHVIDVSEPPPSILAGFRDLVLEGVEVHIGREGCNSVA
ncbi:hypothetical protein K438DRAFT_1770407 [Mycena galopus ATCC 62051]|nr:hypothetical protein K438DRAFT_1770407 [Mycena galopus ATCC 62051]